MPNDMEMQDQDGRTPEGSEEDGQENQEGGETPASWDDYLKEQPEEVQGLFQVHVKGLKSALDDERTENRKLAKQLRDAAEGADAKTARKLNDMAQTQDSLTKKADFYEVASSEGCNNLRLAWIAANDIEAFDRRGNVDINALKGRFPELFGTQRPPTPPPPKTGAGSGTRTSPDGFDMDSFIRAQSGR